MKKSAKERKDYNHGKKDGHETKTHLKEVLGKFSGEVDTEV